MHDHISVQDALSRLLAGSGFVARRVGERAWRIERKAGSPLRSARAGEETPPAAQPPPEMQDARPIVVTAAKQPVPLNALPMAVAVLQLDPVQASNPGSSTALVAEHSEGLAMTSLGPGRNRLFLRGVADSPFNGESQSTVAVVLDETRLTYAAPDPDIRLIDAERVEVLKGPHGSLYGTGALGGIYHIVTRRPDPDNATLTVSAGTEAVAHGGFGWNAAATANVPLVRSMAALRLVGYSAREAGWIDTGTRKDANTSSVKGARASLGLDAGNGWRADVSGLLQLLESQDSRYVYAPGARSRPSQLPEPHDNDMRHLAARIRHEGGDFDLTVATGIAWHEVGDTLDATIGADSFGVDSPSLLSDARHFRVWDSEARASGRAGAMRWLVGLSHVESVQKVLWTLQSLSDAWRVIDDDRRTTHDSAAFGNLTVPLGNTINLDVGARLFRTTVIETRYVGDNLVSRHRHRTGLTPSVSLSWHPSADEIVFLRYASARRQGGSDIGSNGELDTLKSDELATVEAGWRRAVGSGGHLNLGIFASRWTHVQSDMLLPDGLIESGNTGNARILGAEITLELPLALPLAGPWSLDAGANFTDALLVRNMLGRELDDRRLPVVPRFTARVALSRSFHVGKADLQVRAGLRYIGSQRLSFDPAIDRPMGGYLESRIEGAATMGELTLSIAADNLFGATDDRFAFGNSLRFATTRQYTPQRPPTISIGLAGSF